MTSTRPGLWGAILLILLPFSAVADGAADDHVLAGAREFRAGRHTQALVEFRVAEKLGAGGEATWYVAATLVKLGRFDEALERFDEAERTAPDRRDVVLDFYRASACYEARLYRTADRILATLGERAGPQIAAEARRLRDRIAPLFAQPPDAAVIDWYLARAELEKKSGRLALARAFYAEAAALAERHATAYRFAEANAGMQTAAEPASPR